MAILERVRGTWRWLATARAVRRLRAREGGRISSPEGPGAPPRPAVRRPDDDPALDTRLTRWRSHDAPAAPHVPAAMTSRERAAAMRDLQALRARLAGDQAGLIDAAQAADAVAVRRLGPQDGHLWEMPGLRVFAIVGVQAFTVQDEERPGV
jgi:hypothetical protein